ncbi:hypothetical protein FOZ60_006853 [Perkinsus olseni]|uniref:Uncharacterized protein n=1 Tax=Perkinsus olseni TaxID=32597 RepID=A0A7J6NMQ0_PEROL|nr:hypothetical protein FOZ60_006853 [Perkinsus olseni]
MPPTSTSAIDIDRLILQAAEVPLVDMADHHRTEEPLAASTAVLSAALASRPQKRSRGHAVCEVIGCTRLSRKVDTSSSDFALVMAAADLAVTKAVMWLPGVSSDFVTNIVIMGRYAAARQQPMVERATVEIGHPPTAAAHPHSQAHNDTSMRCLCSSPPTEFR